MSVALRRPCPLFPARAVPWVAAVLLAVAIAIAYGVRRPPPEPTIGDTPTYLMAAYHLHAHGTFSESRSPGPVPPAIGREPGYGAFLALLMVMDPAFAAFSPDCLAADDACGDTTFRTAQWANAALIGLSGLTLFAVVLRLGWGVAPALGAAGYLWLNVQMNQGWFYLASDHLAVWLVTLVMLAAVWAWRCKGWWRWLGVGAALAGLSLVKAVFVPFTLLALGVAAGVAVLRRPIRRPVLAAALAVLLGFGAITGGWVLRNAAAEGRFALTDNRSGIALSTREVFNHMTAEEYAAAFLFWTRGFGDDMARRLFPPAVVEPFALDHPGGYYDRGQWGYLRRVAERQATDGVSHVEATRRVDRDLIDAILSRPLAHAAATLPVFYRGIWVDEFVVIGLPLFVWALVRSLRRRDWLLTLLLSAGAFNLVFYPLVSLNVPRYQMTAVPALALAVGLALSLATRRIAARRGHGAAPVSGAEAGSKTSPS